MKMITLALGACLLTAVAGFASEIAPADKKWSEAVESKIAQGAATISTPSETRAKLAEALAAKLGRQCKVEKSDKGFRVVVEAAKSAGFAVAK